MKIIIAGAGDVGYHLAKLLSNEAQDIYIIDQDTDKLDYINSSIDVITIKGDATSISLLKKIGLQTVDILLAVTESQNTNVLISAIGKQLGIKKTIARISNTEFLNSKDIDFEKMGIDYMISPEELAADEIKTLLYQSAFNDNIDFKKGLLKVLGCTLGENSPLINLTVQQAKQKFPKTEFVVIALKRGKDTETIIPRGDTVFKQNDQVYLSTPSKCIAQVTEILGKENLGIKDVMILGGGRIGVKTITNLCKKHNKFNTKLIEINKQKAFDIADSLPDTLVINGDGTNVKLLEEENISGMDAFIAVTGDSETNIMTCLVAKSKGVKKTIALVENMDYINISQSIGIDTLINKKLLAANAIFKHIRRGDILSVTSLHNVDAEILEFVAHKGSKVTEDKIKNINVPRKSVFGGVIRENRVYMTYGDFQVRENDRVIMFCLPEAISDVENLFK
ncbi:MAG: Trk system potassium transporter TrkA [Flavobacteriaceae bacterium]|nr:Trk system potassium transporter TrkA [Flavobacteriaceae bacterium]